MSKKVYVVGGGMAVCQAFLNAGFKLIDTIKGADLVCFTGGEDVSPELYGEKNVKSYVSQHRDMREMWDFQVARANGVPCVGICRGGQFLNVMSGGRMWQDVDNHGISGHGTHEITCSFTGEKHNVSSTHHQMMRPSEQGNVLAVANRSGYKEDDKGVHEMGPDDRDVEVVFYPHTNSLCFQPHPEFFGPGHDCFDYFFTLIKHQLEGSLK
ncbi:MAG: gamma-glutamyl-gamma-aminobutyrate hydrolase family protein [Plesiomonas sp.]